MGYCVLTDVGAFRVALHAVILIPGLRNFASDRNRAIGHGSHGNDRNGTLQWDHCEQPLLRRDLRMSPIPSLLRLFRFLDRRRTG